MVVNELQTHWDEQLPHVEFAYNNSVIYIYLLDILLDSGAWVFNILTFSEFSGRGFSCRYVPGLFVCLFVRLFVCVFIFSFVCLFVFS